MCKYNLYMFYNIVLLIIGFIRDHFTKLYTILRNSSYIKL